MGAKLEGRTSMRDRLSRFMDCLGVGCLDFRLLHDGNTNIERPLIFSMLVSPCIYLPNPSGKSSRVCHPPSTFGCRTWYYNSRQDSSWSSKKGNFHPDENAQLGNHRTLLTLSRIVQRH